MVTVTEDAEHQAKRLKEDAEHEAQRLQKDKQDEAEWLAQGDDARFMSDVALRQQQ